MRRFAAGLVAACMLLPAVPRCQTVVEEYQLKAAFLFNFARYVTWPESAFSGADGVFVLGVLGADPFGHRLDEAIDGREVQGRRVVARRFENPADAGAAQVLYVGISDPIALRQALAALARRPVLTVSDTEGFLAAGGMIELRTEDRRLRFDVNVDVAQQVSLRPSAQLLKLAKNVRGTWRER